MINDCKYLEEIHKDQILLRLEYTCLLYFSLDFILRTVVLWLSCTVLISISPSPAYAVDNYSIASRLCTSKWSKELKLAIHGLNFVRFLMNWPEFVQWVALSVTFNPTTLDVKIEGARQKNVAQSDAAAVWVSWQHCLGYFSSHSLALGHITTWKWCCKRFRWRPSGGFQLLEAGGSSIENNRCLTAPSALWSLLHVFAQAVIFCKWSALDADSPSC